jgi:hypothetical protein
MLEVPCVRLHNIHLHLQSSLSEMIDGKSKPYGSRDDSVEAAHSTQSHYGKKNQWRNLKIDKV